MAEKKIADPNGRGDGSQNVISDSRGAKPVAPWAFFDGFDIHLNRANGWLENNDSFFDTMARIVQDRSNHVPIVLKNPTE